MKRNSIGRGVKSHRNPLFTELVKPKTPMIIASEPAGAAAARLRQSYIARGLIVAAR